MVINERGEVENTIALNEFGTMKVTLKKIIIHFIQGLGTFALILLIISGVFLLITFIKNEKRLNLYLFYYFAFHICNVVKHGNH